MIDRAAAPATYDCVVVLIGEERHTIPSLNAEWAEYEAAVLRQELFQRGLSHDGVSTGTFQYPDPSKPFSGFLWPARDAFMLWLDRRGVRCKECGQPVRQS